MTYQDQIKSPKWQKKRLEVLEKAGFKCKECGNTDNQLHVHHVNYIKNKKIWDYTDKILIVLCNDCHEESHKITEAIQAHLGALEARCGLIGRHRILGYLEGITRIRLCSDKEYNPAYKVGYIDGCSTWGREAQFFTLANYAPGGIYDEK